MAWPTFFPISISWKAAGRLCCCLLLLLLAVPVLLEHTQYGAWRLAACMAAPHPVRLCFAHCGCGSHWLIGIYVRHNSMQMPLWFFLHFFYHVHFCFFFVCAPFIRHFSWRAVFVFPSIYHSNVVGVLLPLFERFSVGTQLWSTSNIWCFPFFDNVLVSTQVQEIFYSNFVSICP